MGRALDLTGQKFGRLTVAGRAPSLDKFKKIRWVCLCDCGKQTIVTTDLLRGGHTKSCGCYRDDCRIKPGDIGSFNTMYSSYELNARKRNHSFSLTREEFREIAKKSCVYCGSIPRPYYAKNRKNDVVPFLCNGIDRVHNGIGYETGNCVPCCDLCNYMKRSMSLDDFLVHIKKIAAHSQENLNGF